MTDTAINNAAARRLPGADRAAVYDEHARTVAPPVNELDLITPPSWDRFAAPTDLLADAGGWVPPAPAEEPAEWGTRQRIIRTLSLGLVKPAPGQEELAHRANVRTIRQAVWPRSVRIVVASPKGGVGKTPTSILLGGVLAQIRGGSVGIWDSADAANTLAARSEGTAARCISDIAAHPDDYTLPATVAMAAATQTSSADVFGSLQEREFDAGHIQSITEVLDRCYRISIADTGNVPHSPAFEAIIAHADTLVIPTVVTADSVNKALSLLRRLQETDLAAHAVVAVTRYGGPETPGLAKQLPTLFGNAGVGAIVDLPFDSHIAQGTQLTLGALSHPSKVAWTRLAATVVSNTTT